MRPFGSAKSLEMRRRLAMKLLDAELSLHEVARRIGCHASSVMRWRDARSQHGDDGLKPKPVSGRPPKLTPRQRKRLVSLLQKGAMAHGYRTELWTTARIAELIEKTFGVRYHRDHIGRLMASLGWSYQKPERRALQRDEKAIQQWKRKQWPRIKKNAARLGAHIVFIDESGFLLIPLCERHGHPGVRLLFIIIIIVMTAFPLSRAYRSVPSANGSVFTTSFTTRTSSRRKSVNFSATC